MSSFIHQLNHLPPRIGNQHIETLPKTQLPHDVVREIREQIPNVTNNPVPPILHAIRKFPRQHRTKLPHMQQHHILHALERMIRERLAEHTPLPPMYNLVNRIVRVVNTLDGREGIVKVRFLEPFPVSVDLVEALDGVDGDEVGGYTDVWAVLFMKGVEPEVSVAFVAVVELDPGGDRGEEWAGDGTEGVEKSIVGDVCDGLSPLVCHLPCRRKTYHCSQQKYQSLNAPPHRQVVQYGLNQHDLYCQMEANRDKYQSNNVYRNRYH